MFCLWMRREQTRRACCARCAATADVPRENWGGDGLWASITRYPPPSTASVDTGQDAVSRSAFALDIHLRPRPPRALVQRAQPLPVPLSLRPAARHGHARPPPRLSRLPRHARRRPPALGPVVAGVRAAADSAETRNLLPVAFAPAAPRACTGAAHTRQAEAVARDRLVGDDESRLPAGNRLLEEGGVRRHVRETALFATNPLQVSTNCRSICNHAEPSDTLFCSV